MKNLITFLFLSIGHFLFAQTPRQLENLEAFNRLYGYVRYFHPSDEAAALDWEKFAIYGSREVEKCKNPAELQKTLIDLFQPIAPTIKISKSLQSSSFSLTEITPQDTVNYKTISWQHSGLGLNPNSAYVSARLNRKIIAKAIGGFGGTTGSLEIKEHRGKEFIFTASVKLNEGPGSGHLWVRVDKENKNVGFFENMSDRPISHTKWREYEIKGTIDSDGAFLAFGCFLKSAGELGVDQMTLRVREGIEWKTIYTNSFEEDELNSIPKSMSSNNPTSFKTFVTNNQASEGKKSLCISTLTDREGSQSIFPEACTIGEYVKKEIGSELTFIIPLALYGNDEYTYPKADTTKLKVLLANLKNTTSDKADDLYVRLGDLVITWNIFQHFYPYFDVAKTDWGNAFKMTIEEAYANKNEYEFLQTLRKFTAQLKDGHVWVNSNSTIGREDFTLPIRWEWIENQLVITNVFDKNIPINAGDIVTSIDHMRPKKYFQQAYNYISAATKGWLNYRAQITTLQGPENSSVALTLSTNLEKMKEVTLVRTLSLSNYYSHVNNLKHDPLMKLSDSVYYIDISTAPIEEIKSKLSDLQNAKAIICDLRGYPNSNHELISYLLPQNDTSTRWMRIPRIIYPDQQHIAGYQEMGWTMKPSQPHLNAKVFFIIDGQAISYAESYLSFIEHYKLATIIGQPSAGTNGNVNPFNLPGGFRISWTGMKVVKHNGSQHHGIGILPNIYVEKTIKGVRDQKDEFLDKAMELASEID